MKITARPYPREALAELAADYGDSLAGLSRWLGRGKGYLARYVAGGPPEALAPADRALLARYFGCDERDLGAPVA